MQLALTLYHFQTFYTVTHLHIFSTLKLAGRGVSLMYKLFGINFFYHIPRKTQKINTVSLRILVKHAVRFIAKKGCCLIVMIGGTAIKCFWRNDHDGYRHDEIKWWRYALNYSQRVVYANISQRTKYSKNSNEYCLWP